MSGYSILEPTLKEILDVIKPIREDWETRLNVIHDIRDVVHTLESFRGATVEPFGSFVSDLFARCGDLDISIELPLNSYISCSSKKQKQKLLKELWKALKQRGVSVQFISNARVPILKFESHRQNISCDLSIDNLLGQMKSKLLFWISEIDGRFRDMVLLVKEWAKAHHINNPKIGTLNSYSLSLLVIFFFQTCDPPILPPLKEIYPANLVDALKGVRTIAERNISNICAANITKFKSERLRINRSSLSELFVSFFAKFSGIRLTALELGICPFSGQYEHIRNNTRWLPHNHPLFIEDPFEQPANTARAVGATQLVKIDQAFQDTYYSLVSTNYQSQNDLLSILARTETSQRVARTRYPRYDNGGHHRTSPQVHRTTHDTYVQHPYQNARLESRPSTLTAQQSLQQYHGQHVRQNHSQVQQMWRPRNDQ